ncbi:MAG TPA: hypothetical protein VKQ36_10675, partial [Ktedonobacterales bacterium]|nr:hypothetical protein [Ktedonobacterales bacterium]
RTATMPSPFMGRAATWGSSPVRSDRREGVWSEQRGEIGHRVTAYAPLLQGARLALSFMTVTELFQ